MDWIPYKVNSGRQRNSKRASRTFGERCSIIFYPLYLLNMKQTAQEIIVNQIIEWLEQWIIPRKQTRITRWQKNYISKENYKGFNQLLLSFISWKNWLSEYRLTYKQLSAEWWTLKENVIPARICFYSRFKTWKKIKVKWILIDEEKQALRYYIVYNLSQINWIEMPEKTKEIEISYNANKTLWEIVNYTCSQWIDRTYWRPAYNITQDSISMPDRKDFDNEEHRLQTYLHEVIHSTGAKKRLDRDIENRMWDELYSKEELVAEIGSAILCNENWIYFDQHNTQAYINGRVKYLKEKPREIINAWNRAFKAVHFYLDNNKQNA